jgi:hypothetical protein
MERFGIRVKFIPKAGAFQILGNRDTPPKAIDFMVGLVNGKIYDSNT